jgi:O-antigen/teichoic acid export membrane protein
MPMEEMRPMLRFSLRVQIANIAALVNMQADAIIIGAFLPIREVALYTTGANLAVQIRGILGNALYPIAVRLSAIFGGQGEAAVLLEVTRVQRNWVLMNTGLFFVAMGASVFVVENWLGTEFLYAGFVCLLLLAGYMVNMFTGVLTLYLNAVGRPDVEARYGIAAMVMNVGLTIPMVFVGLLGIVGATAIGMAGASIYLVLLARKRVRRDIPSFLAEIPWLQGLLAGLISAVACASLRRVVSLHGAPGLLFCALGTGPALMIFAVTTLGEKAVRAYLGKAIRLLRGRGSRSSAFGGLDTIER